MKYKVGDKVLLKSDLQKHHCYGGASWVSEMKRGEVVTIRSIDRGTENWFYLTEDGKDGLNYSFEMIERKVDMLTKDDLKTGDLVFTKDGNRWMVGLNACYGKSQAEQGDILLGINHPNLILQLDNYKDDLTRNNGSADECIVRVARGDTRTLLKHLAHDSNATNYEMIWERIEPKKMTVKEVCEALGYDVEIVK